MKFAPFLPLALLFSCLLQAEPSIDVSLPGKIDSVNLFSDAAYVTRHIEIDVPAGRPYTVEITGIPKLRRFGTLVSVVEGEPLEFKRMTFENAEENADTPEIKALREELAALAEEKNALIEDIESLTSQLEQRKKIMRSLVNALEVKGDSETYALSLQAQEEGWAYIAGLNERIGGAETELSDYTQKESELSKHLNALAASNNKVTIEVQGTIGGKRVVALHYLKENARWKPFYTIQADPQAGKVMLTYQVEIIQKTEEDWNDVLIRLNTNSVMKETAPDRLFPDYLAEDKTPPSHYMLELAAKGLSYGVNSFSVQIPERMSIPSKNDYVYRILEKVEVDAEFWSQTTPQKEESACLMARLENILPFPLLPANAQCFVEGKLMGESMVPFILPGESEEMGLGINQNISIVYRKLTFKKGESGLFGKTRVEKNKYETVVINHMPVSHKVVVSDKFPVSEDEKITVKRISPVEVEVGADGIFSIDLELAPGERSSYVTEYDISAPADMRISHSSR